MITKAELQGIASFKRLTLVNAELDYFLDICLNTISRVGHGLVFKGGTALYKFHNLNRFSEDLDFVAEKRKVKLQSLLEEIVRSCHLLGIASRFSEAEQHQRSVSLQMFFNGPLYDGSKGSSARVTIDISLRERPFFIERLRYTPLFKDLGSFELKLLRIDELLAEKVRAVMTREKPRDVYDVWFLLKKGIKIDPNLVDKKLRLNGLKFSKGSFIDAALRKEGLWESDLRRVIIGNFPRLDDVIKDITSLL